MSNWNSNEHQVDDTDPNLAPIVQAIGLVTALILWGIGFWAVGIF